MATATHLSVNNRRNGILQFKHILLQLFLLAAKPQEQSKLQISHPAAIRPATQHLIQDTTRYNAIDKNRVAETQRLCCNTHKF